MYMEIHHKRSASHSRPWCNSLAFVHTVMTGVAYCCMITKPSPGQLQCLQQAITEDRKLVANSPDLGNFS